MGAKSNSSMPSPGMSMEARLLDVLRQEAAACASLLSSARAIQQALFSSDAEGVESASRQQLRTLAALHRIELARRALLVAWADQHGMAAPTVTVADVAARAEKPLGDELIRQVQLIASRLEELYLVNQCNKSVVDAELGLRRALWRYLAREEEASGVYDPTGNLSRAHGSVHLVERQA